MTNEEFNAWRQRLGLTYRAAATQLGLSERAVYNYAEHREIPLYIELACAELERRHHEAPFNSSDFHINLPGRTVDHIATGAHWTIDAKGPTLRRQGNLPDEQKVTMLLYAGRAYREAFRNLDAAGHVLR